LKRFQRTDGFVLIYVGPGILQRLDPVACEDGGVLFRAAFCRGDDRSTLPRQSGNGPTARARGVDDELSPRDDAITQLGETRGRDVRTREIEFVVGAVVAAVANEDQHEVIVGLRLLRDGPEGPGEMGAGCVLTREREDMRRGAGRIEDTVEVGGLLSEALLVVGLAAKAGNSQI